jgi:hypothetical protein
MIFRNSEMKMEDLISNFRGGKINLIPPFQRPRVWTLPLRKRLLENMVKGKPIPAVFLYKQPDGSQYYYSILDGKQRLESILLFIGDKRPKVTIENWRDYFFKSQVEGNFKVNIALDGQRAVNKSFAELEDELVREFTQYPIATIEIDLNMEAEDGGLKEIIDLFIDINSYGKKVSRFDIVRTMKNKNRLLSDVFDLLAQKQKRRKDWFFKMKDNEFTAVLKFQSSVAGLGPAKHQERIDRMWERLLEIALFIRTKQHRTLAQILQAFLGSKVNEGRLTAVEMQTLRRLFAFLKSLYTQPGMKKSRLATDQPHFYTMVTSIYDLNLRELYGDIELKRKVVGFSKLMSEESKPSREIAKNFKEYMTLSSKQTTHPGRRASRQEEFAKIIEAL